MKTILITIVLSFLKISCCCSQILMADSLDIINPNKIIDSITVKLKEDHRNDSLQNAYFNLLKYPPGDSSIYYKLKDKNCIDSLFYDLELRKGYFKSAGWKIRKIVNDTIWECQVGLHLKFHKNGNLLEFNFRPENKMDSIEVMLFDKEGNLSQYRKMPNFSYCFCNTKHGDGSMYYQEFYKKGNLRSAGFKEFHTLLRRGTWRFYRNGELIREKTYN